MGSVHPLHRCEHIVKELGSLPEGPQGFQAFSVFLIISLKEVFAINQLISGTPLERSISDSFF